MKKGMLVFFTLGTVLLLACFYYMQSILLARRATPGIVLEIRKSDHFRLTIEDLSPWQQQALLAVEDPGFYHHHGIDWETPGQGITTLTQSLAKVMYFHPFKPGLRKLKLMLLAWLVVDPMLSKEDQLTLFINTVYLGNKSGRPVVGLAEAADAYYGKPFGELTDYEYLSIVAMIIAPENFHILNEPEANRERTLRIQKVVSGEYKPKSLLDVYYGPLPEKTRKGLAPASYFPGLYRKQKAESREAH